MYIYAGMGKALGFCNKKCVEDYRLFSQTFSEHPYVSILAMCITLSVSILALWSVLLSVSILALWSVLLCGE